QIPGNESFHFRVFLDLLIIYCTTNVDIISSCPCPQGILQYIVYSPGSSGVNVASPSPSMLTSRPSITIPCIPSALVSVTLVSSPAFTVYSPWSNSKLDAVMSIWLAGEDSSWEPDSLC